MSTPASVKLGKVELPVNQVADQFSRVPLLGNYLKGSVDPEMLEEIGECINFKLPILLEGPTGCGKTATIKWLAHITNNSYERVQMTGSTDIDNFVGRFVLKANAKGETETMWEDGILTRAMKHGYWLLLDEFNMALPEILSLVNSVLDDDRALRLDSKDGVTVIESHENFRLFATMNPPDDYAGTKDLNLATKNRFAIFRFAYSNAEHEISIISKHTGIAEDFGRSIVKNREPFIKRVVAFASTIRKAEADQDTSAICSTRQLIQWVQLSKMLGIKRAANIAIINKAQDEDERTFLLDQLNKDFAKSESFQQFEKDYQKEKSEIIKREEEERTKNALRKKHQEASEVYGELKDELGEFGDFNLEDQEINSQQI